MFPSLKGTGCEVAGRRPAGSVGPERKEKS